MKEAFERFEFGLAEMCFPSPGLGYFKVISRQHYCITLAAPLEN